MSAPIFVSHSSKDRKVAGTICSALEARGHKCWVASRDVRPGENFMEAIVRTIRSAKVMVLIFTENANNSEEIKKEIVLATQHKLAIIPLRVEDVLPNDALAYQFATMQWIDLFDDWEQAITRLSSYIGVLHSQAPGIQAAPQPPSPPPLPLPEPVKGADIGPGIRILPFWATVRDAYRLAVNDGEILFRVSWQWLLLTVCVDALLFWAVTPAINAKKDSIAGLFILLVFFSLFGFLTPIFLASVIGDRYLRFKLLGPHSPAMFGLKLDAGTLNYFMSFLRISMLYYVPAIVMTFAGMVAIPEQSMPDAQGAILGIIAILAGICLVAGVIGASRLLLILPFKALERGSVTIGDVWRRTRHNNLSILLATLACSIPALTIAVISMFFDTSANRLLDTATEVAEGIGFFLTSCVYCSFLFIAYGHLFGGPAADR